MKHRTKLTHLERLSLNLLLHLMRKTAIHLFNKSLTCNAEDEDIIDDAQTKIGHANEALAWMLTPADNEYDTDRKFNIRQRWMIGFIMLNLLLLIIDLIIRIHMNALL